MPVTNVKTRWVDGNLVFYDKDEEIIATFDGQNRKLTIPAGATLDLANEALQAADLALADGAVLIGNASGAAEAQTLTGDVTVTNAGVTAIGADKVVTASIEDLAVTLAKLAQAVQDTLAIVSNIPTSNQASPAIWNDAGVLKVGTV